MADAIGTAYVDVAFDPKQVGGQMTALTGAMSQGLGGIGQALSGAVAAAGPQGALVAAVAGTAVVVGKKLLDVGKSFDGMSDSIRLSTGKTGKDLKGLENDALAVFKQVPMSMEEVGKAIGLVAVRSGETGKPLQDLTKQLLNLSRLTGTDLQSNINSVTRMLGDAGKTGPQAAKAIDELWRAAQATAVPFQRLSDLMTKFGGPMRQLGFSFEEEAALLGKFEKEGVNTELVMGSLRIALGKMAKAGKDAPKALNETMQAIKDAKSPTDATRMAIELFGARAGPDMAAAIREGRFEIDGLVKTITSGQDTINKAAGATDDFDQKWQIFKNNMAVLVLPAATALFDALNKGADVLNSQLMPAVMELVSAFQGLGPVLNVVKILLGTDLQIALNQIVAVVQVLTGVLKVVGDLLRGDWSAAWEDAKGVAVAWVSGVTAQFTGLLSFLQNMLGLVGVDAAGIGKALYDGIVNGIKPLLAAVSAVLDTVKAAIVAFASGVAAMAGAFLNAGKAIITGLVNGIKSLYAAVTQSIAQTKQLATAAVAGSIGWIVTYGKSLVTGFVNGIKSAYGTVTSGIAQFRQLATSATSSAVSWITSAGKALVTGFVNGITGARGSVTSALGSIKSAIVGFFSGAGSWLVAAGRAIVQGLADGILSGLGRIEAALQAILSKVQSYASSIASAASKVNPFSVAPPGAGVPVATPFLAVPAAAAVPGATATATSSGGGSSGLAGYAAPARFKLQTQPTGTPEPASFDVHVYIGDTELRGLVRTEIRTDNRNTSRVIAGGRR